MRMGERHKVSGGGTYERGQLQSKEFIYGRLGGSLV